MKRPSIKLKNVRVHNLKGVDLCLPPLKLIVFTGVSGSGKSSLAFDTIYIEGQRRYIESLSNYARRYLGDMPKPDADHISGISPTIAIEQKSAGRNPRSTVGTMTGVYDYMRVLFAKIGTPHCPISGEAVKPQSQERIIFEIENLPENTKILILAPYAKRKKGEFKEDFEDLLRKGYMRIRLDGKMIDLSEEISVDKNLAHDIDLIIDRISIKKENQSRIKEAVKSAMEVGKGVMSIYKIENEEEVLYSEHAYSVKSEKYYPPLQPQDFSFNHPSGMCPECEGLSTTQDFDLEKIIDPNLSISEDCCSISGGYNTVKWKNIYDNLAKIYKFDVTTPWKKLSEKAKQVFLYGSDKKWLRMRFVHPTKKVSWTEYISWKGVVYDAKMRLAEAKSDRYIARMRELMHETLCPVCHGSRIKEYPSATKLCGKTISEITQSTISEALDFFSHLTLTREETHIAGELLKEITKRLSFLQDVGLHYLTIDRTSPTLSGGESQRVRLASQIGSGLIGSTYILDEPSIGLHSRDNQKLLATLKRLRDRGNSVIVVEHDEETIFAADQVVDVGPGAGSQGGEIISDGTVEDLLNNSRSITGKYLSGKLEIPIPKDRRNASKKSIMLKGAKHHNLKNIDVKLPLEMFLAITGVSGSGKSSLITDTLFPLLSNKLQRSKLPIGSHKSISGLEDIDKVIAIDQSPIGRTPRSNPATYIKLFDDIRDLFSKMPESQAQGFAAGRFSFNVKEGSCAHCKGMGVIKIDMDFLEDAFSTCPHCEGKRFDKKTLSITYKEKNIFDILEMSISTALTFFEAIPPIHHKLKLLKEVGLEYLKLGQSSTTLSGGEAQRIKLAKELVRPSTGHTFYIFDEPTTGLHFHDIHKLLHILQKLIDHGNTVLVIEHNLDLIKTADYIIDLGPEGGSGGGEIMGMGTPEQIAKMPTATGIALKQHMKPGRPLPSKSEDTQEAAIDHIHVEKAAQNNLSDVTVDIPIGKISVFTGPSGSGKTSLAFDTIYAEGQRRYIESLSPYARQFVKQMPKPKVEYIEGLSPAIAIEQKKHAGNPRSTVGTMTEIYDYLRILFAHLGTAYCPETGEEIRSIGKDTVTKRLMELPDKTRVHILSPITSTRSESFDELKMRLIKYGYLRIRLNGTYYELDEDIPYDRGRKNELLLVIDRIVIKKDIQKRLLDAIDQATHVSGSLVIAALPEKDLFFNLAFAVESTGKSYPPITPHTFSFNSEEGMCLECSGLGFVWGANLESNEELLDYSAAELFGILWKEKGTRYAFTLLLDTLNKAHIDPDVALSELSPKERQFLFNGSSKLIPFRGLHFRFIGLNQFFIRAAKFAISSIRSEITPLMHKSDCKTCSGARINPLARAVLIEKYSLADVIEFQLSEVKNFIDSLKIKKSSYLHETISQLAHRLKFVCDIGLHYLSLNRSAPTLSGGETQRIRLAKGLGTGLTGCLYVLDEPTIGLHPHNNALLNKALIHLRDLGNTLILVEHDPMTIQIADYIYDFGPGAGKKGGNVTAQGTLKQLLKNPNSLTGAYLSGQKKVSYEEKRRATQKTFSVKNASAHNLKNLSVDIPYSAITCITGVSGSGKSTLMHDIIRPAAQKALPRRLDQAQVNGAKLEGLGNFDKLISIDQNPIGHTNRADVSTYTELLTPLRSFFASLPAAKTKGLLPKHFSFNHLKGMCRKCWGHGYRSIDLQFLPSVKVTCDACHGLRLNPLSLEVTYEGKNLGQILKLTVDEARDFLPAIPKLHKIIDTLISVGLNYLQIGQTVNSLSGGEAQRLRLSRELAKRSTGKTLYLFDEPTIGLHFEDIKKLLKIFHTLADKGNTIIIIEHNLDIIASSDWIIDLGPEGGNAGGKLCALGPPEKVLSEKLSLTGKYLKKHFSR